VKGCDLSVLEALILGVVQGLTEFLPVSSSGHLVLVPEFFNLSQPTLGFDILVHVATLVAVVGYFARDVVKMVLSVVAPSRLHREDVKLYRRILLWLIIGSIPAAIAGALFSGFFEGLFDSTLAVGIFLVVTSLLLAGADFALGRLTREPVKLDAMRVQDAFIIGCFEALAIAPGLSRSGATISAGIFLGFDRPSSARFSFLLSIPAILGAFVFELKDVGGAFAGGSAGAYVVGMLAAAVSGFAAIYLLLRYVREHRLRAFAIYAAVIGVVVIVLSLV
jgi:undecaprenyl-diphosphatase